MAGADKEEFPALLPVGFHRMDIAGVRRLCVERFPDSISRPGVMENLATLIGLINQSGVVGEVWVDGSFTTEKLNPDDVDLIFIVKAATFTTLSADQRKFCNWFRLTSLYDKYRCDNYFLVEDSSSAESEWMNAYWLRQFGFSRKDEMKGLAVINVPFLVLP